MEKEKEAMSMSKEMVLAFAHAIRRYLEGKANKPTTIFNSSNETTAMDEKVGEEKR